MVYYKQTHTRSDVARKNQIRADLFLHRQSAKSMTVDKKKEKKCNFAHCRVEWQIALVAMKLNSYGVDIAVLAWTMKGILAFEVAELPKKR